MQSSIQYDKLYQLTYSQPATYVRFSSTVEDCAGCPYDLDDEDDAFLNSMNKKRNASTQCSEDCFEEIMNCFEQTAQVKQPYAAVDNSPVLSYEEIEISMDDYLDDHARLFTKDIYNHWKTRRLSNGNRSLVEGLKVSQIQYKHNINIDAIQFETGAETDDADPYVCFRRREVRQIRKTRGRDAHSAERLKKLRKELEESREILAMIRQREILKQEQLAIDRQLFEQRTSLRSVKLNLPDQYKEGDEDILVNQKVLIKTFHSWDCDCTDGVLSKRRNQTFNEYLVVHSTCHGDLMVDLPKLTCSFCRRSWQNRRATSLNRSTSRSLRISSGTQGMLT